jgi:iron complex outermembrane receptor protein
MPVVSRPRQAIEKHKFLRQVNEDISMTNLRQALLAGVGSALAVAVSTPVWAADEPATDIVVTGTRAQNRTKLDSVAPVDVLSLESLSHQGSTELGASLAAVAPSIDFPARPVPMARTRSARHAARSFA